MVFLCWGRPSPEQQKSCINKSGTFNYDTKYKGATANSVSCIKDDKELSKDGYLVNHARVLVGSGLETYEKGKTALQNWRHFGLNWAFVDPKTPIQSGVKFCVCVKEFLPWVMMPLQVVYVKENQKAKTKNASFGFGSGTLQGHLLAGEERFLIELDENDQVWKKELKKLKTYELKSLFTSKASISEEEKQKHAQVLALPPHGFEVFIKGLPKDVSKEDLRELFETIWLTNQEPGESKGYVCFCCIQIKRGCTKGMRLTSCLVKSSRWREDEFRKVVEALIMELKILNP